MFLAFKKTSYKKYIKGLKRKGITNSIRNAPHYVYKLMAKFIPGLIYNNNSDFVKKLMASFDYIEENRSCCAKALKSLLPRLL